MILRVIRHLERVLSRDRQYKRFRRGIKLLMGGVNSNEMQKLSPEQKNIVKQYYGSMMHKKPKLWWHQLYYSVNGHFAKEYVPMDWYYGQMQPRLFNMGICMAYDDKNLYDFFFPEARLPKTIVKCHNGHYYDGEGNVINKLRMLDLCSNLTEAIVKPSFQSAGGENVRKITVINGMVEGEQSLDSFLKPYGINFVVQEVIHQHEAMKKLNPSSVNTVRVHTYFREDEVVVLYAVVRIGEQGSVVDNTSHGGYNCKIHDDGRLDRYAYSFNPVHRSETSQSGVSFDGYEIPAYKEIIAEAKQLHTRVPQIPLIGWDLTIDESGHVVLIEMNAPCGLELSQMAAGPAFGEYTDEILRKSAFKGRFLS